MTAFGIVLSLFSVWGMRQIGTSQNYAETYLDPEGCSLPCWRGIQPGSDNTLEFKQEIKQTNRYEGSLRYSADEVTISVIRLDTWGDITVGDVFLAFGEPSHVLLRNTASTGFSGVQRQQFVGAWLYYGDGLVRVEAIREDNIWRLSPDMTVLRIQYFAPSSEGGIIPIGAPEWHGFRADY